MSADFLHRTWARRGLAARLLWPVSALLLALVTARRLAYRCGWLQARRLPVPVLVIGNRIVGGAGKTPTTIAVLQHLRQAGWHPGVLTRGYKAKRAEGGLVCLDAASAPTLDASLTGDEPLLIWRRTGVPLMIGPDRAAAGEALLKAHPEIDILVCDDGLQHLKLHRDIEVVVFDERGAGISQPLPARCASLGMPNPPRRWSRPPWCSTTRPDPAHRFPGTWHAARSARHVPSPTGGQASRASASFRNRKDPSLHWRALPSPTGSSMRCASSALPSRPFRCPTTLHSTRSPGPPTQAA